VQKRGKGGRRREDKKVRRYEGEMTEGRGLKAGNRK